MHVLVTRPEKQAEHTSRRLRALGIDHTVEPLLSLVPLNTPPPDVAFDAIILTSGNAVQALLENGELWVDPKIPVLTTGKRTADIASSIGLEDCSWYPLSARKLMEKVPAWLEDKVNSKSPTILNPTALHPAHDLEEILRQKNIACQIWPVYQTKAKTRFSAPTLKALECGLIDTILLYSQKTAETFRDLVKYHNVSLKNVSICALSAEICSALPVDLQNQCKISKEPSEASLFELISH